jgi:FRG domain
MSEIRYQRFTSWEAFKRSWRATLGWETRGGQPRFLFRGMENAEWRLETSFDRQFRSRTPADRTSIWESLVEEFRRACIDHGEIDEAQDDLPVILALAQHHGLPTKFLDWSASPYVAAWFALHRAATVPGAGGRHVAIWALDRSCSIWSTITFIDVPGAINTRLRRQMGYFTYAPSFDRPLDEWAEAAAGSGVPLTCFSLPATQSRDALLDLELMGLDASRLFPGLDGVAQTTLMRVLTRDPIWSGT